MGHPHRARSAGSETRALLVAKAAPLLRTVRFVQRVRATGHRRSTASARAIAEATIAVIADFAHRHATGTSVRENRRTAQDAIAICLALLGLGDD